MFGRSCLHILQEPLLVWECSDRYDTRVMQEHLADLYVCLNTPINAVKVGFCANRPRKYGLCFLKSAVMARFGSLQNVIQLFHRERTAGCGDQPDGCWTNLFRGDGVTRTHETWHTSNCCFNAWRGSNHIYIYIYMFAAGHNGYTHCGPLPLPLYCAHYLHSSYDSYDQ